jgi:hydroxypyruvate reductase
LEVALAGALEIDGLENGALITLATDGEDGPTDAAGAIVTGDTLRKARELGIKPELYLENNDSYHFFKAVGGLIRLGPTGTNVNDLMFLFRF